MTVNVCVPVIKRYDLLRELLFSLEKSLLRPTRVYIIDNGQDGPRMQMVRESTVLATDIYTPKDPLSVAESWNWFIQNTPEDRVICNDDITFAPHSLQKIVEVEADLVIACGFSCFLVRDSCVEKVGLFDETISPGYGYYEDEDYHTRILCTEGTTAINVDVDIAHRVSQTLAVASWEEQQEHHRKFKIAQENYLRKWGAMPGVVKAKFMLNPKAKV